MSTWILMLGRADERLLRFLVVRRRGVTSRLMAWMTRLADPTASIGLAGVLFFLPLNDGGGPAFLPAATGVVALAASHVLVQALKRVTHRRRPGLTGGFATLVDAPDRFSFPSGHAAAALSLALPVATGIGGLVGVATVIVAALVGLSRCYLGIHYPGDVLAGWILAGGCYAGGAELLPLLI